MTSHFIGVRSPRGELPESRGARNGLSDLKKIKPPAIHRRLFGFWWRGQDSNLRPLGYEPNELPLLHPAPIFDYLSVVEP